LWEGTCWGGLETRDRETPRRARQWAEEEPGKEILEGPNSALGGDYGGKPGNAKEGGKPRLKQNKGSGAKHELDRQTNLPGDEAPKGGGRKMKAEGYQIGGRRHRKVSQKKRT